MTTSTPNWQNYTETKNKAEVLRFLQAAGWNVGKQTFYNHCKRGLLAVNRMGVYSTAAVKKYAEEYHVHSSAGMTINESEITLATEKTKREIERIKTATKRDQFDLDVKMGRYLLRSVVEVELASRAVVLDSGLEYLFQANLSEMIAIVNGDQQRGPALLEFLQGKKNEQMNVYANMGDFLVALDIDN